MLDTAGATAGTGAAAADHTAGVLAGTAASHPATAAARNTLEVDPSLVQCPHCGRRYSEKAADRHIPQCLDIKAR